jgi:hypothetical protein
VIEMRYFGGLNLDEIGELLEVSAATISCEQRSAEEWLSRAAGLRLKILCGFCICQSSALFENLPENRSAERGFRLDALFQAALDSPAEGRERIIESETEDDAELRRELREMLAYAEGAGLGLPGTLRESRSRRRSATAWGGASGPTGSFARSAAAVSG